MLEFERVLRETKQAEEGSPSSVLLAELKNDPKPEEPEAADSATDDSSTTADDGETKPESGDKEEDAALPTEEEVAVESFRRTDVALVTEDFKDNVVSALSTAVDGLKYLAAVGIQFAPKILAGVYRGVLYGMVSIAKGLYTSSVAIQKFVIRMKNSNQRVAKQIAEYREALALVQENPRENPGQYDRMELVSKLVSKDNMSILGSLTVLEKSISGCYAGILESAERDVRFVSELVQDFNPINYKTPADAFKVTTPRGFVEGPIAGVSEVPEGNQALRADVVLPGARTLMFLRPVAELEGITAAYQHAKLSVVLDGDQVVEPTPFQYLSLDEVGKILDTVERLNAALVGMEARYTRLLKQKANMRSPLKLYAHRLFTADRRVRYANSMLDVVYLRSMLVDKTYIVGSIDFHDYIVGVIASSLRLVDDHLRAYMQK